MNAQVSEFGTPEQRRTWIAPSRTALLIIDMQVDFASPDGVLGKAGVNLDSIPAALSAASRVVHGARKAGVTVIFIGLETRAETDSPAWAERARRRGGSEKDLALCRATTPGANFHGPAPGKNEQVIAKARYSSFVGTDLDAILKAGKIDTLVVCGIATECCVDCTVRDAFHLDYHVFLVADACASYEKTLHDAALASLERNCAIIVEADEVTAAWAE